MRNYFYGIFIIVLVVFYSAISFAGNGTVTNFTLKDINSKTFHLDDYLGKKVIVMSFWATWCIPCQHEMPNLEKLHKKYKKDDLLVIALSIDKSNTLSRVKPYIKRHRYTFTVLLDKKSQVLNLFNPKVVVPFTIVVGMDKKVKYQHEGYQIGDEVELEKLVKKLLKKGGAK